MSTTPRYNQAPVYSLWSATELRDESKRLQHLTAAVKAEIARRQAPFAPLSHAARDEHATWPGAA
jgi:hypothetical protein